MTVELKDILSSGQILDIKTGGGSADGNTVMNKTQTNTHLDDGSVPGYQKGTTDAKPKLLNETEIEGKIQFLADAMHWRGTWAQGQYSTYDVVRDGKYTMIANKVTEDRPAPQPIGAPYYESGLGDVPSWAQQNVSVSSLTVGQRYTATVDHWLEGYRVFLPLVPDANVSVEVWFVYDPEGTPIFEQLIAPFVPTAGGWVNISSGMLFVRTGQVFDLLMVYKHKGAVETESARWVYKRSNDNNPGSGEVNHSNANQMRFHLTPKEGSADLTKVKVGDTIAAGGLEWEVNSVNISGNIADFTVANSTRLQEDEYDFVFTIHVPGTVNYDTILDHYAANDGVQGVFADSGYENAVLNQHAYPVDILVQDAFISDDWDLVAFSSSEQGSSNISFKGIPPAAASAPLQKTYMSPTVLGVSLSIAEIESTITDPLPLPTGKTFFIQDPNNKFIVNWDGVSYNYERLNRAS